MLYNNLPMKQRALTDLKADESGKIISLSGGKLAIKRLADLGLTPGTAIKIIRKAPGSGPLQVEVRSAKLIIGKGLAAKILISKTTDE